MSQQHLDATSSRHILLAHGAGAGLQHDFMQTLAHAINGHNIHVWLFNFSYMQRSIAENKKRPPSKQDVLLAEMKQQLAHIRTNYPNAQLYTAGKSMGARVACSLANDALDIKTVFCFGYPFHPVGKPETTRLSPLLDSSVPVVIFQGQRDTFGNESEVLAYQLPEHVKCLFLADGDHSLKPRKSSGVTQAQHITTCANTVAQIIDAH